MTKFSENIFHESVSVLLYFIGLWNLKRQNKAKLTFLWFGKGLSFSQFLAQCIFHWPSPTMTFKNRKLNLKLYLLWSEERLIDLELRLGLTSLFCHL